MAKETNAGAKANTALLKVKGRVVRVARLHQPERIEFTAEVKHFDLGGHVFTIGERITFEVNISHTAMRLLYVFDNLQPTDDIEVQLCREENGDGKREWIVKDIKHFPHRGRMVGEFLDDLETSSISLKKQ